MFHDLKYKRVMENFKEISDIPRCSYQEEQISNFLYQKIRSLGLECIREKCGNIIAKKPASKGYEGHEGVILQAHMDMVCVKIKNSNHDFTKDPIELVREGDVLRAKDTTLGADNGIGVAMILSILEDQNLQHPPITAFITIAEETGMDGAISANYDLLQGTHLINLDSEEDSSITVACSGGIDFIMNYDLKMENAINYKSMNPLENSTSLQAFEINISEISGGHSGIDINKKGACAIKLLNRFLINLNFGRLFEINAGNKRNAIPVEAHCKIVTNARMNILRSHADKMQEIFRKEYCEKDPEIKIEICEIPVPNKIFTSDTSDNLLKILSIMPHGVDAMAQNMENLVETSSNLAIIEQSNDRIQISTSIRSSLQSKIAEMVHRMSTIANLFGVNYKISDGYPAWEYKQNNKLLEKMKSVYEEIYGKEPEILSIHAGLECAFFAQKLPDVDMISFGPNIYFPHTTQEYTEISSIEKNYEYLIAGLKSL